MPRPKRPISVLLLVLAAVAAPAASAAPAGAAGRPAIDLEPVFDEPLGGAEGTTAIACQDSWRPRTAGVATSSVAVPGGLGRLRVTLAGTDAADWDVAVFDASGKAVVASAERGSSEAATGWTLTGGSLRVQVCRVSGGAASVPVLLEHAVVRGNAAAVKADPPQLVSVDTPTRADKDLLLSLGMDMTEHGGTESLGVVLYGEEDRAKLRKAGLTWRVLVADLVEQGALQRRAEARAAARGSTSRALPSGRTEYRTLADYNSEMKALAAANPGLVKTFVMPNKTWLGKEVMGIEITTGVDASDGKPVFFNMGVHHAREWPAGEMPMEWAHELVNSYKAGDARARNVVENSRNIIVPIVNPDGFEASRSAGPATGRDEAVDDTAYLLAGASTGGEYRRKNCRLPDDSPAGNCGTSAGLAEFGVDPNRNYGGLWGGPGADTNVATQTYRGPGPFSEPETRNIQDKVSRHQVMTLITNHTTAGLILRAPGLAALGDPVDEDKGYKALGDEMAKHNGYFSQKGFELYDTTGTTEDWSYNATGGFGFTFEIYCGAPNYETGNCDDPAFHPFFETGVVKEWEGTNPQADHSLPGAPGGPFDGQGNREAYYIAAESTLNEARHSVIEGAAPAGARLRLSKSFKTLTSPQPQPEGPDKPLEVDDRLDTVLDVGADGRYKWHINPSTRPIVAKARGKENAGPPSPEQTSTGGPSGSSETADDPDDGAAVPDPSNSGAPATTSYNDHPFTVPASGDNASLSVNVAWTSPLSDWDVILFADENGDGKSQAGEAQVGTSAQGATNFEEVSIAGPAALTAGKKYVLRVVNFTATEPYTVTKTYVAHEPFTPAQVESWTLTCEVGGKVLQTTQVTIARGEKKSPDLGACAAAAGPGPGAGAGPGAGPGPGTGCVVSDGFAKVGVKPRGRGADLSFRRSPGVTKPVGIKVYQQARGRRLVGAKVMARFANRKKSVRWNGRANRPRRKVTNGYYFVRFRVETADGADTRRVALRRSKGRFKVIKPFHRRASCGLLRQFKLGRSVFGGTTRGALKISYLLSEKADVTVVVQRGGRTVKTFAGKSTAPGSFKRLQLPAGRLRRGSYTVRLVARSARSTVTATLTSRRL